MAHFASSSQAEGHSTSRPPFFNGTNYGYWKTRMQIYLMQDASLMQAILKEVKLADMSQMETWTMEESRNMEINAKAMNTIICALSPEEFNRVSTCKTAKEMWDKLQVTHEGTNQVKETKINLLVHEYELFSMKENESIKDMYTRFNDIMSTLESLGKIYTNGEKVRKILRSLPMSWDPKVTAITEAKDLDKLEFDNLLGSLMTHEIMMKRNDKVETKKSSNVAFKAENEEKENQDSEDDDFVMLAKKFNRFMKKGRSTYRRYGKKEKDQKDSNISNEVRCFECKKAGHMRNECPTLKKKEGRKKGKKALAAWSDEDLSSDESQDEEVANVCFMANSQDEVNFQPTNSTSEFSLDELYDAFNELISEYEFINQKNKSLRKENDSLGNEVEMLKSKKESLLKEKERLNKENEDMKESLEKLVEGKKKLEMILGAQRSFGDKQGIGFDPSVASTSKTVFIRSTHQEDFQRRNFHKSYFNRKRITCHYCGKNGHSINKCFIRNHPHRFKQIWVPKEKFISNKNGPKEVWVPKGTT